MERDDLRDAALRCIRAHVERQSAFTAYNITCRLHADGRDEPHRQIRRLVHDLWSDGAIGPGFSRTLTTLPEGARAFVYHPADRYNRGQ